MENKNCFKEKEVNEKNNENKINEDKNDNNKNDELINEDIDEIIIQYKIDYIAESKR